MTMTPHPQPRRLGRQSDLARELLVTPSAVSSAVKRHGIPVDENGLIDLDYAKYLMKTKGDIRKQEAQRIRPKPDTRLIIYERKEAFHQARWCWENAAKIILAEAESAEQKAEMLDMIAQIWVVFHEQVRSELFDAATIQWEPPPIIKKYFETQMKEVILPEPRPQPTAPPEIVNVTHNA